MKKIIEGLLKIIAMVAIISVVLALPVMWVWNAAFVGTIDGVHEIGFWNALGILFLCSMLFKNNTSNK